jgi:hypothetical protein
MTVALQKTQGRHAVGRVPEPRAEAYVGGGREATDANRKGPAMAMARIPGDGGHRVAPAMGALRYALARETTRRESAPRGGDRAFVLGLDDATLATFGYGRIAVDFAGRGGFPL